MSLGTQFLARTRTLQVLKALSIPPADIPCPDPSCTRYVTATGGDFVCRGCSFGAGNLVDYLASTGRLTPEEAVDTIHEADPSPHNWAAVRGAIVDDLTNRYELMRFLLDRRYRPEVSGDMVRAVEWLEAQGIQLNSHSGFIFLLDKPDLAHLCELVDSTFRTKPKCPDGPGYVVPYFHSPWELSSITVIPGSPPNPKAAVRWKCEPARVSFAGTLSLTTDQVVVRSDLMTSLKEWPNRIEIDKLGTLAVAVDPSSTIPTRFAFRSTNYLLAPDEDFKTVGAIKPLTNRLLIDSLPWIDRVVQEAIATGAPPASIPTSPTEEQQLSRQLLEAGFAPAAVTDTKQREVRGATVFETPEGYSVAKGRAGRMLATNFTFAFRHSLYFRDDPNIWYSGDVRFRGKSYPVLMKREALSRPIEFEKVAAFAKAKAGYDGTDHTPAVHDRVLASSVSLMLMAEVPALPRLEGVMALGWDPIERRFESTRWRYNGRLEWRRTMGDPDNMSMDHFDFVSDLPDTPPDIVSDKSDNPATIRPGPTNVLIHLAAQTARVILGKPAYPLQFGKDPTTTAALRDLFRTLSGQDRPIRVAFNRSHAVVGFESLRGHPALVDGEPGSTDIPMWCTGGALTLTKEEIPHPKAYPRLVAWIIEHANEIVLTDNPIEDGRRILAQSTVAV